MRLPRYLALAGASDPFGVKRAIEERALREPGMQRIMATPRLILFSDAREPLLLPHEAGAILGPLRARPPEAKRLAALDGAQAATIVRSRGGWLIDECWGDHVAFLDDPHTAHAIVQRAPFGVLDCLYREHRGVLLLASDLALLRACTGDSFEPDWQMVAAHLVTEGLRQAPSCIAGVEELLWGERLVVHGNGLTREVCWSPWTYAATTSHPPSPQEAATHLRETALATIGAQARDIGHVLLMLSGGLDSSILAACLAARGTHFTCLNLTTGDSTGDERHYARMVAEALGARVIEAEHDIAQVDVTCSYAAGLARPIARSFAQATRYCKQAAARSCGANAVFDGGGGDNLFCFLQSVTPVADRLRAQGVGRGAWETAREMAGLAETSVFTIMRRAVHRAWLRSPRWRWPLDARFLTPHACTLAGEPAHRWLEPPCRTLPGSAAHVALLIAVENLLETADGGLAERSPLMSQPLVEMCLSIPSWYWCSGGHNRTVAREAFAPLLPREVIWRRSKGTPDALIARLYENNREVLARFLGDGLLAAHRLIDRDAVLSFLASAGPVKGHAHLRLLKIADVEAWLRSI